jgi:hypothetical protein
MSHTKKLMNWSLFAALVFVVLWVLLGCQLNPETGRYELVSSVQDKSGTFGVDTGKDIIDDWGAVLSAAVPSSAGAIGLLGIIFGGLQRKRGNNLSGVSAGLVLALEDFKKTATEDQWIIMETQLKNRIGPKAENIIRAFRGLPSKTIAPKA